MKNRSLALVVVAIGLGCAGLMNSGCVLLAAGAAGAGTVAYVRGDLEAALSANINHATEASVKAIEQLNFSKISEKQDSLNSVVVARTAEDKRVEIKIAASSDKLVKVSIRVGVFGDERIAMAILEKIKANL